MPRGTPSIPTLLTKGADLLRLYVETDTKRTTVLRDLARVVVSIRAQTLQKDGRTPDWAGQSQAYRDNIRQMYEDAGIPPDTQSNVQSALRYHIGEVLREVATPKALSNAGLATKGPKDRARERNGSGSNGQQAEGEPPAQPRTTAKDPEACLRLAIEQVQTASTLKPPKDPSVLLILTLTLEHACQALRDAVQAKATEQVLQAA